MHKKGNYLISDGSQVCLEPPETTSGPFFIFGKPLLKEGFGFDTEAFLFFMSKSEGTSEGGGLGGRWDGVPHFAIES